MSPGNLRLTPLSSIGSRPCASTHLFRSLRLRPGSRPPVTGDVDSLQVCLPMLRLRFVPRTTWSLFDLDNTLSDFASAQRAALPALLADHGISDGGKYLPTFKRLAAPLWEQLEAGELTLDTLNDERFRLLIEHTDLQLDPASLAPQYLAWLGRSGVLWPGAIEPSRSARRSSNHGLDHQRLRRSATASPCPVRTRGLFHLSHRVSSEIGHAKPSQAFF